MRKDEYQRVFELENSHWWYLGMQKISFTLLSSFQHPKNLQILDAGCGTGGMTVQLKKFGSILGIDMSPEALKFCRERKINNVKQASIENIPTEDKAFDLVTSFDVIYHKNVEDDQKAINEFYRVLKPEGRLLVRVPAYDWLKGHHDKIVSTKRRYSKEEIINKIKKSGFEVQRATYANTILFPIALLKRVLEKFLNINESSDVKHLPKILNEVLKNILSFEAFLISKNINLPFGLSIFVLAQKPN